MVIGWFFLGKREGSSPNLLLIELWLPSRQRDSGSTYTSLISVSKFRVTSYTESSGQKVKPLPLNTVELLKVASSNLGMSPNQTMHIAENLYAV